MTWSLVRRHMREMGGEIPAEGWVAGLIVAASEVVTLEPGDVIATGTPSGVGAGRGLYLRPGDVVQVTIDGLGTLENTVIDPAGGTS